jgi:hypothetical protein
MAKFEKKPGRGALFIKQSKNADGSPQMSGYYVDETGKEHKLNAWLQASAAGVLYFSLGERKAPKLEDALEAIASVQVKAKTEDDEPLV